MKIVELSNTTEVKELVKGLKEGEPLVFIENRMQKYVLTDANTYMMMDQALLADFEQHPMRYFDPDMLEFEFIQDLNKPELTLEEYEKIKKQLIDALEKNFKPSSKYKLTQS